MLSFWKSGKVFVVSTAMFSAGIGVATVALSYLPSVTAAPGIVTEVVKQTKAEQVVEKDGLKWELQNCQRASQNVICNFLVTNVGQTDRDLLLDKYGSRFFDLSGNEYSAEEGTVGRSNSSSSTLIRGIPTKANVTFIAPQEITNLAAFEVGYVGGRIQFRNVNVSSSQASNPTNPRNCTCPPQTDLKKTVTPRPR